VHTKLLERKLHDINGSLGYAGCETRTYETGMMNERAEAKVGELPEI
jgi:hypothetical protein